MDLTSKFASDSTLMKSKLRVMYSLMHRKQSLFPFSEILLSSLKVLSENIKTWSHKFTILTILRNMQFLQFKRKKAQTDICRNKRQSMRCVQDWSFTNTQLVFASHLFLPTYLRDVWREWINNILQNSYPVIHKELNLKLNFNSTHTISSCIKTTYLTL